MTRAGMLGLLVLLLPDVALSQTVGAAIGYEQTASLTLQTPADLMPGAQQATVSRIKQAHGVVLSVARRAATDAEGAAVDGTIEADVPTSALSGVLNSTEHAPDITLIGESTTALSLASDEQVWQHRVDAGLRAGTMGSDQDSAAAQMMLNTIRLHRDFAHITIHYMAPAVGVSLASLTPLIPLIGWGILGLLTAQAVLLFATGLTLALVLRQRPSAVVPQTVVAVEPRRHWFGRRVPAPRIDPVGPEPDGEDRP